MIHIKIDGKEETIIKIDSYDVETRDMLKKAIRSTAKAVTKKAKALAPVGKTGNLRDSIKAKYIKDVAATVAPRKPKGAHRHLVEYGTAGRSTRKGANRGKMSANPFMKNARQSQESSYTQKVRSIVNRNEII